MSIHPDGTPKPLPDLVVATRVLIETFVASGDSRRDLDEALARTLGYRAGGFELDPHTASVIDEAEAEVALSAVTRVIDLLSGELATDTIEQQIAVEEVIRITRLDMSLPNFMEVFGITIDRRIDRKTLRHVGARLALFLFDRDIAGAEEAMEKILADDFPPCSLGEGVPAANSSGSSHAASEDLPLDVPELPDGFNARSEALSAIHALVGGHRHTLDAVKKRLAALLTDAGGSPSLEAPALAALSLERSFKAFVKALEGDDEAFLKQARRAVILLFSGCTQVEEALELFSERTAVDRARELVTVLLHALSATALTWPASVHERSGVASVSNVIKMTDQIAKWLVFKDMSADAAESFPRLVTAAARHLGNRDRKGVPQIYIDQLYEACYRCGARSPAAISYFVGMRVRRYVVGSARRTVEEWIGL